MIASEQVIRIPIPAQACSGSIIELALHGVGIHNLYLRLCVRDLTQFARFSSERLPSASIRIRATTSGSGASNSSPLTPRKVTIARKPIRLFPSR